MSSRSGLLSAALFIAFLLAAFAQSLTAAASDPFEAAQCGRVGAYTPPSGGTAGSVTLGSRRFQLQQSPPRALGVGEIACISGPTVASNVFLSAKIEALPPEKCGLIRVALASSGSTPGGMTVGSGPELVLKVPLGGALPAGVEGTTRCVLTSIDGVGDAIFTGFAASSPPASLPSTSTSPGLTASLAVAAAIGALFIGTSRRRRGPTPDNQ